MADSYTPLDPTAGGTQTQWTPPDTSSQPFSFGQSTPAGQAVGPTGTDVPGGIQTPQISDMPSGDFSSQITQPTFMQGPWGQVIQAAVPGVVGLYGARQQQNLGNQVAGTVPAAAQPATSIGAGVSRQLQGGAPVGGPMGVSIGQQTGAAQQLGNVAQQYASGNLTPAQKLALQQGVNAATASKNLAFSMAGNPMSSASIAESQNINNQAIIASQQIQQNNIKLASDALQTVQSVYNNLVTQVLNAAGLGAQSANAAAQMIMKNNQDVQKQISSIWQNITKSILGAAGQSPEVQNFFKNILGKNTSGAVNPQDQQTVPQYQQSTQTDTQTVPQLSDMSPTGGGFSWGNFGGTDTSGATASTDQTVTPGGG